MNYNYFSPNYYDELDYDDFHQSQFDFQYDQSNYNHPGFPVRQLPGFPGLPGGFPTTPPPFFSRRTVNRWIPLEKVWLALLRNRPKKNSFIPMFLK
ncbi:hypothetical protein ACOI1C_03990 [Bacillus sp. DJP31]|uniref:hypothetical protein n=1 Tax=Bacillus sp. DJP31 TaxID=3409789 RepID=UPI003BB5F308